MKIIVFAWGTMPKVLDGTKTLTHRDWDDKYAERFQQGEVAQAYDKNPRNGGQKRCLIMLTKKPYKHWLHEVNDEDEKREGGLWGSGKAYQEAMGEDRELWAVEFELYIDTRERKLEETKQILEELRSKYSITPVQLRLFYGGYYVRSF